MKLWVAGEAGWEGITFSLCRPYAKKREEVAKL